MLLIGSRAAKIHFKNFREPNDFDVMCSKKELEVFYHKHYDNIKYFTMRTPNKAKCILRDNTQIELEVFQTGKSSEKFDYINNKYFPNVPYFHNLFLNFDIRVANPFVLFFLKKSHIEFNIHWQKNILDYSFLKDNLDLNSLSYSIKCSLFIAYKERLQETQTRCATIKNSINNTISNDDFFNNSVKRYIDHDRIHEVMAYNEKPLFFKLKYDLSKANIYKELFDIMSISDKVKCVQEEAFVLATERILIPKFILLNKQAETKELQDSFQFSLRKICTDLKDNPFFIKDFAIENYTKIVNYNINEWQNKLVLIKELLN